MIRTIVIGAGVMGASVAYRLAQAGAAVTVLEATRIGGGTSGISFAWTNAHEKPPKPYHDLNVAGMKATSGVRTAVSLRRDRRFEFVGSPRARHRQFFRAARCGDDPRAHRFADLDRGQPNPAGAASAQSWHAGLCSGQIKWVAMGE